MKHAPDDATAYEAYMLHANASQELIEAIQTVVITRTMEREPSETHWGHAGDMQKVNGVLEEVAAILGLE